MAANSSSTSKVKLNGKQWAIIVSIVTLYFFAPTFSAVNSLNGLMPEVYGVSPADVSWIGTIGSITSCIAGLCVGLLVGKRVSYRVALIFSAAMFAIFGGLPFFWQDLSWPMLLASRAIFGLGVGCINPLVQSIITHMVQNETARASLIGIINIVFSIGASVGSMIVGALGLASWQTGYAFYLFAFIPLILIIIFVHDQQIISADEKPGEIIKEGAPKEKTKIPGGVWGFICTFALCTLVCSGFFAYAGIAMAQSGVDTLVVGTVLTAFTVAGIVVAAANALLWKAMRLFNFPVSYLLLAAGFALGLIGCASGEVWLFFASSIVMGVGCCLTGLVMPMALSVMVPAASLTMAISFQEIARNLGTFLASPVLVGVGSVFGDTAQVQFTAMLIISLIGAAIGFILAFKYNKKFKNVDFGQEEAGNPHENTQDQVIPE